MSNRLDGKVCLVTGASRGLGAAIAVELGRLGARVGINTFANPEKGNATATAVREAGGQAIVLPGDVRSETDVRAMTKLLRDKFGPIDVVVCNATGPQPFVKIEDLTWQSFLDQLDFFVKSPMLLMQAVVADWKSRRYGRFVNIGSEVFERAVPEFSQYVAAKGGQLGLTRSWARELAPWQITVNLVAPGWIPTERHTDDPQEMKDAYAAAVPMQRMGVPADVGAAVAFLASDAANFVTGQKLAVNGGNTVE